MEQGCNNIKSVIWRYVALNCHNPLFYLTIFFSRLACIGFITALLWALSSADREHLQKIKMENTVKLFTPPASLKRKGLLG